MPDASAENVGVAWLLVLGLAIGLVVWLAAISIGRRRVGWVVATGFLSVVVGVVATGLGVIVLSLGCLGSEGHCDYLELAVDNPWLAVWTLVSGGLLLFGVGLWGYAINLAGQSPSVQHTVPVERHDRSVERPGDPSDFSGNWSD